MGSAAGAGPRRRTGPWALATAAVVIQEGCLRPDARGAGRAAGFAGVLGAFGCGLGGDGLPEPGPPGDCVAAGAGLAGACRSAGSAPARQPFGGVARRPVRGAGLAAAAAADGNRLAELSEDLFEGLGRLASLDLGGNRLSSLPAGLLADAPSLSRLHLGNNRLSELPDGFFEGASNLAELDLSGNPGAPFTLTMELTRTDAEDHAPGPATVVARVAEGAPFALSAGLVAEVAELSTDTAAIEDGDVSSAPIQVSLTEGGAARLSLSGAPEAPSQQCGEVDEGRYPCFQGLVVEAGPGLLLFKRRLGWFKWFRSREWSPWGEALSLAFRSSSPPTAATPCPTGRSQATRRWPRSGCQGRSVDRAERRGP